MDRVYFSLRGWCGVLTENRTNYTGQGIHNLRF